MSHQTKDSLYLDTLQSWKTIIISSLFFCYIFAQMTMFNAIGKSLILDFHLTAAQFGHLSAGYFYGNLIFLVPAGILLDRYSAKTILLSVMFIASLATYLFTLTNTLLPAMLVRILIGMSGAFALLATIRIATRWFSSKNMALVVGVAVTIAMFGGMVAQTPFTWMTAKIGWRMTLTYVSAAGGIIFLLILFFVSDYPKGSGINHNLQSSQESLKVFSALKQALLNKQNWFVGATISLLNLPVFIFGATWGGVYLQQMQHISFIEASHITSMIFLGLIIGSPLFGWLSDRYSFALNIKKFSLKLVAKSSRKQPLMISAILSLLLIAVLMLPVKFSYATLLIIFFLVGFVSSFQICGYPLITEHNPPHLAASASSIASMLIMSGGFVLPLFGWLMAFSGDTKILNHQTIYTYHDFVLALSLLPICYLLAAITCYFSKEGV